MVNPSKQKGTAWETAIVRWFHERGHHGIERRALNGTTDRGDIAGIPTVVIEAKNTKGHDLAGWTAEAATERDHAGADIGVVFAKRKGSTNVGDAYAILPVAEIVRLLEDAGHLPPPQ